MNILCDQCVNRNTVLALREAGFNVIHTSEVRLSKASDADIFHYAQRTRRVLLTFDHDFGNITQFPIRNSYGVVIIYVAEMDRQAIIDRTVHIFEQVLKQYKPSHHLFIVEANSIRIWPVKK